ncbi:proteinase B, partial [Massospora cicadina]
MKKVKTRSTGNVTEEVFRHIYREGLVGYSGTFSWDVMAKIRQMEDVKLIERDGTIYATDLVHQVTPPWGLARVSRRRRIPSVSIPDYVYDSVQSGAGVTCYVIDTGINVDHDEFGMRARWGATLTSSGITTDDNGHGTHVAGTIGSAAYGVAKDVELVAVKVLDKDGIGTTSDIIAGINWAVADTKANPSKKGSIANLSLGGAYSQAINMAVEQAVLSGLGMIVAAGNENKDACNYSPASSPFALSVGATNIFDKKAPFSNHGKCVSLFAPGEQILSTYIGSTKNTKSLSGTSMASPHVAGLAACF